MELLVFLWMTFQLPTPPTPPTTATQPPTPPEIEEEVFVTATRTGRLSTDQVVRVEVVGREEIE